MAAKKPAQPKKFKQARATAKRDAQAAIDGKVKARRKDTTIKTSAEDKAAIAEQNKQGRADMKSGRTTEYEDSMRRQEEARKARFNEDIKRINRGEDIDKPKPAATKATKPVPPKIQGTSQAKANAVRKGPSLVENGKVVSKARAQEIMAGAKKPATKKPTTTAKKPAGVVQMRGVNMTPAQADKAAAKIQKVEAVKPSVKKPAVVNPGLNTAEETAKYKAEIAKGKSKKDALAIAKGGSSKAVAVRGSGTKAVVSTAATAAAKKGGSKAALGALGRGAGKLVGGRAGLAIAAGSVLAGPIISGLKKLSPSGAGPSIADTGKAKAAKAGNANDRLYPKGTKPLGGSSKQDQAMANRGKSPMVTPTGGGSSTKVYRVEQGDTLEAIAKKAGVTLSELKKANPKAFSQKYIFRNTPVNIPQGKAIPSGSYKGPVPYVPGSSAAKKYEASRKK